MQVVTEPVDYLANWAAERIKDCDEFQNPAVLGICRNGKLACVAVYSVIGKWPDGGHAEISFASDNPRWATREAVNLILGVGFHTLGCTRLTARARKGHKAIRKLLEGVGFRREGAMKGATRDGSTVIIYGLLQREFEEGKYGQEFRRRTGCQSAGTDSAAGGAEPADGVHPAG